jgi:hypothetical protein
MFGISLPGCRKSVEIPAGKLQLLNLPDRTMLESNVMNKKLSVIAVALCFSFMAGLAGCGGKQIRHLASDACMVTPGTTTKQEVMNYLGQPDVEYETADGKILWVYYEEREDLLRKTPYIGKEIGEETYEIVKVAFKGDKVENIGYQTMKEDEFKESGIAE